MGKCGNCKEEGHTIRVCPKLESKKEDEYVSISLPDDVCEKLTTLTEMCNDIARSLKKGFYESVYEEALAIEFQLRGIQYSKQEVIPITYKDRFVGTNRLDIILHNWLPCIIELKATSTAIKSDEKWQILRYMTRKDYPYGVVINFNQSIKGQLELVFIIKYEDIYYQYNHQLKNGTPMIDFN